MLELFAPYALFISFLITVLFNLWLISKNVNWIVIIIANLLLMIVMDFLNLNEYNFVNRIVEWFMDFVGEIFKDIWDSTLGGLIDKIKEFFGISTDPTEWVVEAHIVKKECIYRYTLFLLFIFIIPFSNFVFVPVYSLFNQYHNFLQLLPPK